ncbi:uncharacterized protein LOC113367185 [Ctenocephalides felis]|uniref:uncharacterized protein LOC113367185 n=1 Tax=Ctenocephalides felis TaxID=7515 RepID=UPI000E6E23F5|nr:uncharacterized protein LOC113367185 [Ctenocephalides felis]
MLSDLHDNDSTPTNSDQEDLLVGSDYEDFTDFEDIQFAYAKSQNQQQQQQNSNPLSNYPHLIATQNDFGNTTESWRHKFNFLFTSCALVVLSFLVTVLYPIYWRQLELNSQHVTRYSGLLFVATVTTATVCALAVISSWVSNWDVRVLKPPFNVYRTLMIGCSYGLGGTLITMANSRIPCHLQDPLKALTMLLSLIFYFFMCRRVMGLQRIFSATTSVVGLFIAVDYGLCDEYRCRGFELSTETDFPVSEIDTDEDGTDTWRQRLIWTLVYVIGLALWTLHITFLESHIIQKTMNLPIDKPEPPTLLSTVSRLVSHSDPLLPNSPSQREVTSTTSMMGANCCGGSGAKRQTRELHMLAWIHLVGLIIVLFGNWIDMLPSEDKVTSPSEFIYKTHRGLSCHFEIPNHNTLSQQQLDYLSNLTPHSQTFNKTSRNKRDLLTSLDATKKFQMNYDEYLLRQEFHKRNYKHEALMRAHNLRKHKLNRQHTNVKVSKLITNQDKCELIRFYGWMFTLAYIAFVIFLVRFLILCESAVFTMSLITMALPFAGLYWSVFKLVPQGNVAIVEWGPAVTGEMICCLLGLPIVMLGTILLCKAHFRDCKQISYRSFDSGMA